MKLVFATHNQNKFLEVQKIIPKGIELLSLNDMGCTTDIAETGSTLKENAQIKCEYVVNTYNLNCFSDDTGLLVNALNGEPGVYSARYAGEEKSSEANMDKLLHNLKNQTDRSAYFETVIALHWNTTYHFFSGKVDGVITHERQGDMGFGYDPIFMPNGYEQTFAQLPLSLKNKIGHRGKAMAKLLEFLSQKVDSL